jgi:hypothetical protein
LPYKSFRQDECLISKGGPFSLPNRTGALADSSHSPDQVGGQQRWEAANKGGGFSNGLVSCAQPTYQDPNVTAQAIKYMRLARNASVQFFLAVGECRHGPAFDKLRIAMLILRRAGLHKPHLPFSAPQWAYDLYPREKVSLPMHPGSFMDAQLGDILSELNALGLASNTVVALHGDVRVAIQLL